MQNLGFASMCRGFGMVPQNLVFIMSDEHNVNMLGCYGHPMVKTPNIDRLAAAGTRFTSAYTNCPICVPVRASFATGRYAHQTGYWDNAHPYDDRLSGWGHLLQATGHQVVSIGKLHYRNAAVGEESTEKNDLPGKSWFQIAVSPNDPARDVFSEYHTAGYTLRRGRYKYVHYVDFPPELFDLENDPEEAKDLSATPGRARLVREFEAILRQITDPEGMDQIARADQAALVQPHGGREAVLSQGGYFGSPTPAD